MSHDVQPERSEPNGTIPTDYRSPTITYLGELAELTQKTVGNADGSTFIGLDIGSI